MTGPDIPDTAADAAVRRAVHAISKPCPHDPPCILHTAYQVGVDQGRVDGRAEEREHIVQLAIECAAVTLDSLADAIGSRALRQFAVLLDGGA